MRIHPLLIAVACAALVGCPKSEDKKADHESKASRDEGKDEAKKAKKKASSDDDDDDGAKAPKHKKKKSSADDDEAAAKKDDDGARDIAGVGKVPAYAKDPAVADKCTTPAAVAKKIAAYEKGDDASITDGTADLSKLDDELAGSCRATAPKALATALNDGGMKHYSKGKMEEANRWWRAALTIRPANAISRYNLACGLARDGKKDDALWALAQLGLEAKDGDETAANYLEKAKSDSDLVSVRSDPAFEEAVKTSDATWVGPRREPETSKEAVKLLPKGMVGTTNGPTGEPYTYKPALLDMWTWRPDPKHELVVAQLISDPALVGNPQGSMNPMYGGIVLLQRDAAGKPSLVLAKEVGLTPPTITHSKANTLQFEGTESCGSGHGTIGWAGGKPTFTYKACGEN